MADQERILVSVYQIDTQQFGDTRFKQVVDALVKNANKNEAGLLPEKVANKDFGKHQVQLFSIYKKYPPRWRGFLEPVLDKQSRLTNCENIANSYVCFIGIGDHVFAVGGGWGSLAIARYTTHNFGLEILVRLFKKESKVIKGIQDRGLTGTILGQTKFYRGDQRFSDEDQFGKIFQEVKAELSKRILTKNFGFPEGELKRKVSGCLANASFQIKKAVDFDTLLTLIDRFVYILDEIKPKFTLNKVELINKRNSRNHQLIQELNAWAIDQLYADHKKGVRSDIDFCHKDFENYLTASCFQISLNKSEIIEEDEAFTLQELIRKLQANNSLLDNGVEEFKHSVLFRQIYTQDEEGIEMTRGTVLEHVHGEFGYQDKTYFLVDGEWYRILPSFIKDLNEECKFLVQDILDEKLVQETFDLKKRESVFNLKFVGKNGYLVFDTITPENIELCDILQYDEQAVRLIHVKKGFDNSIRELASQINIAAKRLREDLRTGYDYLEKLEQQAKKGRTSIHSDLRTIAGQSFPHDGLSNIFKNRRPGDIEFYLAFVDEATNDRHILRDLATFKSNIAKFTLLELHREIKGMGFEFKLVQLKKN
jgi:uncharacterized protein (TIGR04141 family)